MVKLIETTTFKDGEEKKHELKFDSVHRLYAALAKAGVDNKLRCELKLNKTATIHYEDATTKFEIVNTIVLPGE